MWNKPLMWNSPKMWNRPKEVEQGKDQQYFSVLFKEIGVALDVEQSFDAEQPKHVEQPTGPKRWNREKISNIPQCFTNSVAP